MPGEVEADRSGAVSWVSPEPWRSVEAGQAGRSGSSGESRPAFESVSSVGAGASEGPLESRRSRRAGLTANSGKTVITGEAGEPFELDVGRSGFSDFAFDARESRLAVAAAFSPFAQDAGDPFLAGESVSPAAPEKTRITLLSPQSGQTGETVSSRLSRKARKALEARRADFPLQSGKSWKSRISLGAGSSR